MKKLMFIFLLAGCTYTSTPVLNQADLSKVDFEALKGQRIGRSCQNLALGIFPTKQEASIANAAWAADIRKVSYVEESIFVFAPIFTKKCVLVYGE